MSKLIDITYKKFGMLTAIKCVGHESYGPALWKFRCDCGKYKVISGRDVRRGHTTSCGCMKYKLISKKLEKNLTGKIFGKLTVLKKSHQRKEGKKLKWYWQCKCECGTIKTYRTNALTTGNTKSCGCLRRKLTKKQIKQIIISYKSGEGCVLIGRAFSVHSNTILNVLKNNKVTIRH